jgi:cellulose synthase/poly-beta-1,6-N-acetylglucosamine synthase-like glycosyltransferase
MLSVAASIVLIAYAVFIIRLMTASGNGRGPGTGRNAPLPGLSVVIPFRNEAHRMQALLSSLAAQDYRGPWEVVLVNDESVDRFREAIAPHTWSFPVSLTVVDSVFTPSICLTSKQQALDKGVATAAHEWCVFTDADMVFEPNWLSLWADNATAERDLVFGHTEITRGGGIFSAFQRFQLEFLFAAAYSFHAAGIDSSCMGNNLLVRKKAYEETGGMAAVGYSIVEDRDLYALFRRKRRNVAASHPFIPSSATFPCTTFHQFYHQMLRWARGGLSPHSALLWAAALFGAQNVLLLAAFFGLLSHANAIFSFVNFFLTMLYVHLAFKKTGSRESALFFPVFLCFMMAETAVFLASFVVTRKVAWKKRMV